MGLSILAALAIFVGTGTAAHAGCATSTCPAGERPTTTQQATEVTLERRIENALKDLDSATARTLNADQERLNELMRKSGVYR